MGIVKKYFSWLQKGNPTGEMEKYPEIDSCGETYVKGIFVIGDLTGMPLLKFAAESGKKIIDQFVNEDHFKKYRESKKEDIHDFAIIGAGPAGIAAGLEALKHNFSFTILESSNKFSTIHNFSKGKPIFAEPNDLIQESQLKINDGTKESLLVDLNSEIKDVQLPIVEKIVKRNGHFEIVINEKMYKSLRVLLAIGKSGNALTLNVPKSPSVIEGELLNQK